MDEPLQEMVEEVDEICDAARFVTGAARCRSLLFLSDAPGPHTFELRSWAFDAFLVVERLDGTLLGTDNNGLYGCQSRLVVELSDEEEYVVRACALHGEGGEFELVVSEGSPAPLPETERHRADLEDAKEAARRVSQELGEEGSLQVADRLNRQALLLNQDGRYSAARPLLERCLAINEVVVGPKHENTAAALGNLAILMDELGRFPEVGALLRRSLAIREEIWGPKHPLTVGSVGNLANHLMKAGKYDESRALYERGVAILEELLGPAHPETAGLLNNLGILLREQGNYAEAQQMYERSLAIHEQALGPTHRRTAAAINNLAHVLQLQDELEEARPLFERSLAIWEEVLGPEHPDTASSKVNLANLLEELEEYDEAQALYQRSQAILEKGRGPHHPTVSTLLNDRAELLTVLGEHEEARRLLQRSLDIHEVSLGRDHPELAPILNSLADLCFELGETSEALDCLTRSFQLGRDLLRHQLAVLSERERFLWMVEHRMALDAILRAGSRFEAFPATRAYQYVLDFKGMVSRGLSRSREFLQATQDPLILAKKQELHSVLGELSAGFFRGQGGEGDPRLQQLRQRRDSLERELSRAEPGEGGQELAVSQVQEALAEEEVLLDFVFYRGEETEELTVFVLDSEQVRRIDLGQAQKVSQGIRHEVKETASARGAMAVDVPSHEELRALLWDPLVPSVARAKRVFVCPDGSLATLPFETLPGREPDRYLIEQFEFVYLQTAFDVLSRSREPATGTGALIVGGIDFESGRKAFRARGASADVQGSRGLAERWQPLQETLEEASDLYRAFTNGVPNQEATLLTGANGTEAAVKHHIAGKRFVHLATHAFFAPLHKKSMEEAALEQVQTDDSSPQSLNRHQEELAGWLPGLLSGIVFAGANATGDPSASDAILTAEELAWLDLSGCELVTLSACETGLGEPRAGEQLIGLRRALRLAGARTTVTSLWRVDDAATRELMTDFYQRLWLQGQGKAEALRAAQLALLERNRARVGKGLPSTWGAFVLEGDWR